MNAQEAIVKTAVEHGWKMFHRDTTDTDTGRAALGESFMKDDLVLNVYYHLFGSAGSMRLMRYYGKDERDGINWGVEYAVVHRVSLEHDQVTVKAFTGAKKKQQILAWLKGDQ